jgi:hypothetical protein
LIDKSGYHSDVFVLFVVLLLIVLVGLVYKPVEGVIHVPVLDGLPDLFDHVDELLSYHIVDSERENRNCFVSLFKVFIFSVQLHLEHLCLLLVASHLLHQLVLTVDQLESVF